LGVDIGADEKFHQTDIRGELGLERSRSAKGSDSLYAFDETFLDEVFYGLSDSIPRNAELGAELAFRWEFFPGDEDTFHDPVSCPSFDDLILLHPVVPENTSCTLFNLESQNLSVHTSGFSSSVSKMPNEFRISKINVAKSIFSCYDSVSRLA
jgi:hypothetical protein